MLLDCDLKPHFLTNILRESQFILERIKVINMVCLRKGYRSGIYALLHANEVYF